MIFTHVELTSFGVSSETNQPNLLKTSVQMADDHVGGNSGTQQEAIWSAVGAKAGRNLQRCKSHIMHCGQRSVSHFTCAQPAERLNCFVQNKISVLVWDACVYLRLGYLAVY